MKRDEFTDPLRQRKYENQELWKNLNKNAKKRLLQQGNWKRFLRAMATYLAGAASAGAADASPPLPGHPSCLRIPGLAPAGRLRRVLAALLKGDWLWLELLAACCLENRLDAVSDSPAQQFRPV